MAKKVLIIDDDRSTVKFLAVVLDEHGYETDSAFDGKEGLLKVKEARPDLVVLDVMMPKKSGFTLFKQMRKDEKLRDLPVLMLTGVAGVLDDFDAKAEDAELRPYDSLREALRKTIRQMRDEGLIRPEMFLDKPVDPEVFMAKVQELIGG
ncbi:MAG: response regulator [Planctomycetes bacterium]|nr:response regulator [Planctomycetota bacterium]